MIPESPRDPARAVDQDGAGAPQKSAPSRGISTTSLTTVSGPKIPLTAQRDISTQSPVLAERSWHKASTWLRETYRDRGKTILNGLAASTIALPVSSGVAFACALHGVPKVAIGPLAMTISMVTWDFLYSAQLYWFYDRKLMPTQAGKVNRAEFKRQVGRYIKTCLEADLGWIISYQLLYAGCVYGLGTSATIAASAAHAVSILYVDLLRPVLLRINRTLRMDQ